ncbi:MAG: protein translocase subunit SecF [Methanobacteriaceae archaeon]|jgi:preprotein translocase subunit SecF|uniref:protein translocase subunit SecF n=1 Tax=unclassified Methanobrevibacter TaxID=2638681 RepID=UPI003759E1B2|nr:protein translocase subunit SecF [Methanobacteriaceae archaeon]MDD4594317.1 protein translocase subunit SecF [Methanobacteriaceae archaeon]
MFEKFMESYKKVIFVPIIITIIALALIAFVGVDQGIELKGGSTAEVQLTSNISPSALQSQLSDSLNTSDISVYSNGADSKKVTVDISNGINDTAFTSALGDNGKVASFNAIGPVLSQEAMGQVYWALLFAFIFMAITVFIVFREPVPSVAVILAALCDIVIAIGGMALFKIPLSIASVGALLMLIGYSVDTDILLTTRLLKRHDGTVVKRASDAMETGLTMSISAISAMVVLYIVTAFLIPEASTLTSISSVLILGLCADILTTWCMNLTILRVYLERSE